MKPKVKQVAKPNVRRLDNARRKLSLPVLPSSRRRSPVAGPSGAQVTSIYTRPNNALPFNAPSSSLNSTISNRASHQKSFGAAAPAQDRHHQARSSTSSIKNPTHSVKEDMAINGHQSYRLVPQLRPQKKGMTVAEARRALSLNDVEIRAKVNVARPGQEVVKNGINTRKDRKAPSATPIPEASKGKPGSNRTGGAILEAVVTSEALVNEAIESAHQKIKKIRFAEDFPENSFTIKKK